MLQTRRPDNRLLAVLAVVAALGLGVVYAAAGAEPFVWDPAAWARDVTLFAGALLVAIGFIRARFWPELKGRNVQLFGVALGATSGLGLFFLGYFDTLLGGLSHGVQAALLAFVFTDGTRAALKTDKPALQLAPSSAANAFILDFVRGLLPAVKLPAGMQAIAELLAQFAQSELVLTDDVRADLQKRVLAALRKAGVVGVDV